MSYIKSTKRSDLEKLLEDEIAAHVVNAKRRQKALKDALKLISKLSDNERYHFAVTVSSYWAAEGEEDHWVSMLDATLEEAVRKACTEFKAINRRSDIQGDVRVTMHVGSWQQTVDPSLYAAFVG